MTPDSYGQLALAFLGATAAVSGLAWVPAGRQLWAPAAVVLLAVTGLVAALPSQVEVDGSAPVTLATVLAGLAAVAGGGPITALVFDVIDRHDQQPEDSIERAGALLRGGAWIGVLERVAIYVALVAGWPEGAAVALAIKGVGRYPELRDAGETALAGAAERFIIGTFTSALWAVGCAGVARLLVG